MISDYKFRLKENDNSRTYIFFNLKKYSGIKSVFNYKPYVIWQQFSLQMIFYHLNKLRRRHSSKDQNDQIEAGSHHLDQKQLFLPQCLALFHRLLPDRPLLPLVTDRLLSCMVVGTQSCKLGAKGLTTYTVQLMLV